MAALHTLGTPKNVLPDERSSSVLSSARCVRIDITWAMLNYVHHNPVRHAYVERWTDWPWSSAAEYLAQTGASEAKRVWREYPLHEYGKNLDDPEM